MKTLDVAFMTELSHRIMLRFDATSMKLQDKTADLDLGVRLLKSLLEYVTSVRENFLDIQESAKRFSSIIPNQYKHENKRKKTRK